jgi:hypothetical protein
MSLWILVRFSITFTNQTTKNTVYSASIQNSTKYVTKEMDLIDRADR